MKAHILLLAAAIPLAAADFHLDCASGDDAADASSPATAWKTTARASRHTFGPGDRLLLKRGITCEGPLAPKGSGAPGNPAVVTAYGAGPAPRVHAPGAPAAVALFNQSHWRLEDFEAGGSTDFGIHVSGDRGTLRNIELRDLLVRDVHGKLTTKNSGLVVVESREKALFEDILIDGVTAESTSQWAGIIVNGGPLNNPAPERRSRGVIIRNSIARDVYGDGIVLFQVEDGLIERSAAWHTGMEHRQTIGTPNGIWTWSCTRCIVRQSEAFWIDSPGVDGGAFDIDWGNTHNTVEESYGHDTQAYCIAVFGAARRVTSDSLVRDNVCAGNGRSPRLARHHGAIHLLTWNGGTLDGVRLERNLIEWSPPVPTPAIKDEAEWATARRAAIVGNIIRPAPRLLRPWTSATLAIRRDDSPDGRALRVIAESARAQFTALGLKIVESTGTPQVTLTGPSGSLERSWKGYAPAKDVLFLLRQRFGEPRPVAQP